MSVVFHVLMALAGLVFIAPSLTADLIALIIASPTIITQVIARRKLPSTTIKVGA